MTKYLLYNDDAFDSDVYHNDAFRSLAVTSR